MSSTQSLVAKWIGVAAVLLGLLGAAGAAVWAGSERVSTIEYTQRMHDIKNAEQDERLNKLDEAVDEKFDTIITTLKRMEESR